MTGLFWDLDGTLVDSADDIAGAADGMLVEAGLRRLGVGTIRTFIGDGAKKLVDRCVVAAGGQPGPAHVERFLALYRAAPVVHTRVYPGIAELLDAVVVPQAVVTNKPEVLTRMVLDALGLSSRFGVVIGGDTLPVRKPDPAPLRLAAERLGVRTGTMVGDGPADVEAARAAGFQMIGVDWGIARPERAETRCADVVALRTTLAERGLLR